MSAFLSLPSSGLSALVYLLDRQTVIPLREAGEILQSLPSPLTTTDAKANSREKRGDRRNKKDGGMEREKKQSRRGKKQKGLSLSLFSSSAERRIQYIYTYAKLLSLSSDEGKGEEIHKPTLSFFPEKEAFLPNGKERERKGA